MLLTLRSCLTAGVIAVIGAVALTPAQVRCDRGEPLTQNDVFNMVRAFVLDATIVRDGIEPCGVSFILDDKDAAALGAAGAGRALIAILAPPLAAAPGMSWRAPTDGRQMVRAPEGPFQMGSPDTEPGRKDDEIQHTVQIPRGFWIDVTEVTNEAFRRFLLANPSWQRDKIDRRLHDGNYLKDWNGTDYPAGKGDSPVVWVSWHAASAYAKWASKRLPSEAEWEYAARAGTRTAYWWGDAFDSTHIAPLLARPDDAALRSAWNTVAMLGGVWEWTSTGYRPYPYRAADGREDAAAVDRRVKRGGSGNSAERFLRAANRSSEPPEVTSDLLGFRCVR